MTAPSDTPRLTLADGRVLDLPQGWSPVEASMFATALAQTRRAFTGGQESVDHALAHLRRYYDPASGYAGVTFLDAGPDVDDEVTAADLWAVSTLSMKVPPDAGRALLSDVDLGATVRAQLRVLPPTLRLPEVTAADLSAMRCLYDSVRTTVPPLGEGKVGNKWVFAAKLAARKRPELFPVRDSIVCRYLADNNRMGGGPGQLGWFVRDIQAFAYLISHPDVERLLGRVRSQLHDEGSSVTVCGSDLRLLDVVLWMEGQRRSRA